MRARLPELHPRRGLSTGKGAVSPMDQMIDHPTIERTSSEGTSGERTGGARRRPAARTWMVGAAAALALLLVYLGSSYYQRGQATAPPAAVPSVTVSKPLQRDVDTQLGFLGQFSAIDRVELRAQVGGTLTEIHVQDGQIVQKGDLLFVIDPRPYEIRLAQANAQLQTATARVALASSQLTRAQSLRHNDFGTQQTVDQRINERDAAEAAIEDAKARIRDARLDLESSLVTAPFRGRLRDRPVSVGRRAAAPPAPSLRVAAAAVLQDQAQPLVMTVSADGSAGPKIVQTGALRGSLRVIRSGLQPDHGVAIDGLVRAAPGSKVAPQDGVIH